MRVISDRPTGPATLLREPPLKLWVRQAKVRALQGARLVRWLREPALFPAPEIATRAEDFPHLLYERRVGLLRRDPAAHPIFEAGKRMNLQLAAPSFDGVVVRAGRPLSFWRALGAVTAAGGYQPGMELRGGCIIPSLGGGLCLLSNALFGMAVELGWQILERHGHTLEAAPPPPDEVWGLDATVFYPYVDLRVAPQAEQGRAWLRVRVEGDQLRLSVYGDRPAGEAVALAAEGDRIEDTPAGRFRVNRIRRLRRDAGGRLLGDEIVADNRKRLLHAVQQGRNCMTCNETSCHARPELLKILKR